MQDFWDYADKFLIVVGLIATFRAGFKYAKAKYAQVKPILTKRSQETLLSSGVLIWDILIYSGLTAIIGGLVYLVASGRVTNAGGLLSSMSALIATLASRYQEFKGRERRP